MGNFRFFNRPDIIYRTLDSIDKLDWRSDNLTKKSYKEKENLTFTNNIHLTSFEETVSSSDEDININLNSKENQLEHQNKQILSKKSSVASVDSAFANSCNHIKSYCTRIIFCRFFYSCYCTNWCRWRKYSSNK